MLILLYSSFWHIFILSELFPNSIIFDVNSKIGIFKLPGVKSWNRLQAKIEALEKRAAQIQAERQKLVTQQSKNIKAEDTKRKIILGALLIIQSRTDVAARKIIAKLIEAANERDKEFLTPLLNFNEAKQIEQPIQQGEIKWLKKKRHHKGAQK